MYMYHVYSIGSCMFICYGVFNYLLSEREGMFSRTDSGFVGNVSGDTFSTKLINKSLHWEDKVTEVMDSWIKHLHVHVMYL